MIDRKPDEYCSLCELPYKNHAQCPLCGYTWCDVQMHGDHHLCGKPQPEPPAGLDGRKWERLSDDMPYPPGHELDGVSKPLPPDLIHETNNQINNNFYESVEEGVRKIVFLLRNAGINTECSCHHDGYIQCQTLDPTTDVMRIKAVMAECNISNFTIKIKYEGFHFGTMDIYSPSFVMKENEND